MPFIAIAAVIVLALGGGVTVAADQARPGEALYSYKTNVNDQVRHEYHAIKASLNLETKAGASASGDTQLSGSPESQNFDDTASSTDSHGVMLRVREDASDEAKAHDDQVEGSGVLNADGSVHVNVY